ncbi:glycosyltransferase family 2 protein [Nocardia nepalensis]|uniref:glycosyltransferase family 2 protein n=1 Tax=Nocardia nepalensis TaxID=3375448 RepID=UPI003B673A69
MSPLVSVVIPTFNRPDVVGLAISSVQQQRDVPGTIEVIVVNDGGIDVSSAIAKASEHGQPIRLIDLATNSGLSRARNAGIDAARGEFLALLDDDDVYLPNHISTMLTTIDCEKVDAAYGVCGLSTTRVDPQQPSFSSQYASYPFDHDLLSVANFIPVHAPVLRMPPREARFDPGLSALEDWDMWLHLTRRYKYRFHHVPQPTVVYHQIPGHSGMCATAAAESSALAGFSRLAQHIWRRWPATTAISQRFRLYITVMYCNGLTTLAEGKQLRGDYFQRCMDQIAEVWHGDRPEGGLADRIIDSMTG